MASSNIRVQRVRVRLPHAEKNTARDLANDLRSAMPGALARKQLGSGRTRSIATVDAGVIRGAEARRAGTSIATIIAGSVADAVGKPEESAK